MSNESGERETDQSARPSGRQRESRGGGDTERRVAAADNGNQLELAQPQPGEASATGRRNEFNYIAIYCENTVVQLEFSSKRAAGGRRWIDGRGCLSMYMHTQSGDGSARSVEIERRLASPTQSSPFIFILRLSSACTSASAAGFPLHFLFKCTKKGAISAFSIENHRKKRGKPDLPFHLRPPTRNTENTENTHRRGFLSSKKHHRNTKKEFQSLISL